MQQREKRIELDAARKKSSGLNGIDPAGTDKAQAAKKENFEMHEDELREFLLNRIAELKSADLGDEDDGEEGKFKFKASTISNVLPSGHLNEQTRLAANYKNRFRHNGEKLHQRLLNQQQKNFRDVDTVIRKNHAMALEQ